MADAIDQLAKALWLAFRWRVMRWHITKDAPRHFFCDYGLVMPVSKTDPRSMDDYGVYGAKTESFHVFISTGYTGPYPLDGQVPNGAMEYAERDSDLLGELPTWVVSPSGVRAPPLPR